MRRGLRVAYRGGWNDCARQTPATCLYGSGRHTVVFGRGLPCPHRPSDLTQAAMPLLPPNADHQVRLRAFGAAAAPVRHAAAPSAPAAAASLPASLPSSSPPLPSAALASSSAALPAALPTAAPGPTAPSAAPRPLPLPLPLPLRRPRQPPHPGARLLRLPAVPGAVRLLQRRGHLRGAGGPPGGGGLGGRVPVPAGGAETAWRGLASGGPGRLGCGGYAVIREGSLDQDAGFAKEG